MHKMRKNKKQTTIKTIKMDMDIVTKYGTYGERELAQLIRRNMITREHKDKTKYTRKNKHKINYDV